MIFWKHTTQATQHPLQVLEYELLLARQRYNHIFWDPVRMTLYRQNQEESRRKSEFKAAHRKLPNVSKWETSKHQRPVQFECLRAKKWTWFFLDRCFKMGETEALHRGAELVGAVG